MGKKMGRPPIPAKDQRSVIVPVRMTPNERLACEQAASEANLTLSAWIRGRLSGIKKKVKRS